jgi:hypothetical protein
MQVLAALVVLLLLHLLVTEPQEVVAVAVAVVAVATQQIRVMATAVAVVALDFLVKAQMELLDLEELALTQPSPALRAAVVLAAEMVLTAFPIMVITLTELYLLPQAAVDAAAVAETLTALAVMVVFVSSGREQHALSHQQIQAMYKEKSWNSSFA